MEQLSLYTTTTEPVLWSPGATTAEPCTLQVLRPECPRAYAPHQEKPTQWEAYASQLENGPCSPQLEKSQCSNEDPPQPNAESWTVKKAERWRIDAFELWCWRRLLRVPWIPRRSIQTILKEISPEYSLEGLMLKLRYSGHLMWRAESWEKTLMLGKIEGNRRRGWERMRWLDSITDSMDMNLSNLQVTAKDRGG